MEIPGHDRRLGVENVNPHEELKRLDEQIKSATELAALKPIYFRLNEIIQAFPGDFDVQFTGNEIKQRLMARGTLFKQQETSPPASPVRLRLRYRRHSRLRSQLLSWIPWRLRRPRRPNRP